MSFVNVLNVRDFGAIGDEIANDRPAIQRALDAARDMANALAETPDPRYPQNLAAGTTVVYVPRGIYQISHPLVVYPGTTLRGADSGSSKIQVWGTHWDGPLSDLPEYADLNTLPPVGNTADPLNQQEAIIVLPHADRQFATGVTIRDITLENVRGDLYHDNCTVERRRTEFGIYAPRASGCRFIDVAVTNCLTGYFTHETLYSKFLRFSMGVLGRRLQFSVRNILLFQPDALNGPSGFHNEFTVCSGQYVEVGYHFVNMHYSTFNNCAIDYTGTAYRFENCRGISLNCTGIEHCGTIVTVVDTNPDDTNICPDCASSTEERHFDFGPNVNFTCAKVEGEILSSCAEDEHFFSIPSELIQDRKFLHAENSTIVFNSFHFFFLMAHPDVTVKDRNTGLFMDNCNIVFLGGKGNSEAYKDIHPCDSPQSNIQLLSAGNCNPCVNCPDCNTILTSNPTPELKLINNGTAHYIKHLDWSVVAFNMTIEGGSCVSFDQSRPPDGADEWISYSNGSVALHVDDEGFSVRTRRDLDGSGGADDLVEGVLTANRTEFYAASQPQSINGWNKGDIVYTTNTSHTFMGWALDDNNQWTEFGHYP